MKTLELKGNLREAVGKKTSKNLRREDQIPCVMYGNGKNFHFHTHEKSFKQLVFTPNAYLVNFDLDGNNHQAVLRAIQFHPVSDKIIHADFFEITDKEPLWIQMPVEVEGSAVGVLNGGRLVQKMRKVKVKGLLSVLPDDIKIDITNLDIGQSVKIADLKVEGLEFMEPANAVVVLVKTARAAALAAGEGEEGEEGAEGETPAEGGDASAEKAAE
ncbi:MAG: 50S ribosomal protein L25/general stress protein Ctc [Bacteroidales bacterium]|nr:50S ribosomal protein L25/general stress protein Ctc [Bacteroidales bacterium]